MPITDQPEAVELRKVGGHWERDLIMGRRPSAVISLVEWTSRQVVLVALPDGIKAPVVRAALVAAFRRLPEPMVKSLTWDRGRWQTTRRLPSSPGVRCSTPTACCGSA